MFSCIKYKPGKDKDEDNERRESGNPKPKESSKGITKQLKGLALKVTGGSSSKQSKASKGGSSSTRYHQQQRRLPAESETDQESEQQQQQQQHHDVPSYVGGSTPAPTPAAWDHNITGYDSSPGFEISSFEPASASAFDLGFVAVPTPPSPRAISSSANNAVWGEQEQNEPPEWLAHVEEGITIAFVSLPTGVNDLRRIRFSRDLFDRDLAQSWWIANYDRVRELYNVQSFNREAVIPAPGGGISSEDHHHQQDERSQSQSSLLRFEQEGSGMSSTVNQPTTYEAQYYLEGMGMQFNYDLGASSSSSAAAIGPPAAATLTPSNSFRIDPEASSEVEWVEQDEPGVFITIKKYADGTRQIRRLRFSREHFETDDAKIWWLENKERVEAQYL